MRAFFLNKRTGFLFAIFLLWWIFTGLWNGADLSDSLYSVGNYAFFHEAQGSWHYATFLANLLGRGAYLLGEKYVWISLICRLVPVMTAVAVYCGLRDTSGRVLALFGLVPALGLNWSPAVILYQHLSYLVFTLGAILLYHGMTKKERKLLVAAGLVLGAGLFVRISNLTYCVLILYVFYADLKAKEKKRLLGDVLSCVGGYLCGALVVLLLMLLTGGAEGIAGMFSWIGGLLSGNGGSGGYTLGEMLWTTLDNYLGNLRWVAVAAAGVLLGTGMFALPTKKFVRLRTLLYCLGITVLMVYYCRNGVFNLEYRNVGCMFHLAVVALWIFLGIDLWVLLDPKIEAEKKGLALLALLMQLITPLGSNNHVYSCINNMYFIAPVGLYLMTDLLRNRCAGKVFRFPLGAMVMALWGMLLIQSICFHTAYGFKDGTDGSPRDAVLGEQSRLEDVRTSAFHAMSIEETEKAAAGYEGCLLTYGDIPGFHYLLDLPPAISTMWPDLESYPAEDFERELNALEEYPLCILSKEAAEAMESSGDKKLSCLREFLYNNAYEKHSGDGEYVIYERIG